MRFDAKGVLYAWLSDLNCLATVDIGTGAASPLPQPTYPQTLGGGIAFDKSGRLIVSVGTSAGTLDAWTPGDDKVEPGPTLNGAPFVSAINSMAFSENGTLYAVNSNLGAPAKTRLIRIDPATGRVADVGALPADVDPLAFAPSARAEGGHRGAAPVAWAAGAALVFFVIGFFTGRVTRRRRT
jgi:sugar lactone lactonase YvrE